MNNVTEEPAGSRYPKRKRTSIFNTATESKLETVHTNVTEIFPTSPVSINKCKSNTQDLRDPGVNGVVLGVWRYSSVPDNEMKHAVIGFIDVSGRLRTRIQPKTKRWEPIAEDYPLPLGVGKIWVTFERIIFSDHLVGLHYFQVKEYTRIRSQVTSEESEEGRSAADHAAVQEAVRRFKEQPASESRVQPPAIAYGVDIPGHFLQVPIRSDLKLRAVSGRLAVVNPAAPGIVSERVAGSTLQDYLNAYQNPLSIDPPPGTQPTHILIGRWKLSNEVNPKESNSVYGVLDQSNGFHVQLVLQTTKGRYMNGNYATDAGALWIPYEEVELEPHLKALNRLEVEEYCHLRQYQLDHQEISAERIGNETKAVYEARIRAGTMLYAQPRDVTGCTSTTSQQDEGGKRSSERLGYGDNQSCQSRGLEPGSLQAVVREDEWRPRRPQDAKATEISRVSAHREIVGAEAAQGQAIRHSICRELAMAAAAAAADTSLKPHLKTNGPKPHRISDDMRRLNNISARQETLCTKSSSVVKIYGGYKYERKMAGPFVGNLVSQGTVINIDGEDYVEYRVLTKPSFF